jgi:uncharacterized protein YbjT (DUF2867 family)
MSTKTATLIGATGLTGNELLTLLLQSPFYEKIRVLVRRPFPTNHPKLEKKLVDFSDNDSLLVAMTSSYVVFCAVGTTQKKVNGDKVAYRKVDYEIPLHAARFCKMTGCKTFVMVSAVGANKNSNNFYLKLKGETEEAVKTEGPESIHIMRPSVLTGDRKEFRPMEKISMGFMKIISFLLPSKFRPIKAKEVAAAMLAVAKDNRPGAHIYHYREIKELARTILKPGQHQE